MTVKPEITGWAHVWYPYGNTKADATQKLQYDQIYVKNMGLFFDITVIFRTVKVVLLRPGGRESLGRPPDPARIRRETATPGAALTPGADTVGNAFQSFAARGDSLLTLSGFRAPLTAGTQSPNAGRGA